MASSLSAIVLLAGCTSDSLTNIRAENLAQGSVKTLKADLVTGNCSWTVGVSAEYKKSTDASWISSGAATLSGNTYASQISGSDNFSAGQTYDYHWIHKYQDWDLSGLLPSCPDGITHQGVYPSSFTVQSPPTPVLGFSPAGPLTINAGSSSSVQVTAAPAPTTATSVTLTVSSGSISAPASTSIAGGQTTSPAFTVNGQVGGSATITAAASGFQNGTLTVNVLPVITSLSPTSGARGTVVTINGTGFASGSTVSFGSQNPPPTFISSSQLRVTEPIGVAPGNANLQVTTNSQQSNLVAFTVLPTEVVLAGGPNNNNFAVLDFTNPNSPHVVNPNPGFSGGTAVDCSGSKAAVGNLNGGQVVLYDITNPASPTRLGTVNTVLGGVGAIKFDGTRVLAGEMNGSRVILIDASNPNSPQIFSTFATGINSISSLGMSGNHAVASGPNNFNMEILDYTNPAQPTGTLFNPNIGGGLTADLDGTLSGVGALTGPKIALLDITTPAVVSTATTQLGGTTSISIKGSLVAAGSTNNFNMVLIDFTNRSSPVVTSVNPNLGGGWTVALNPSGNRLAAGNITGSNIVLFRVSGTSTNQLANVTSTGIGSIGTVCISDF